MHNTHTENRNANTHTNRDWSPLDRKTGTGCGGRHRCRHRWRRGSDGSVVVGRECLWDNGLIFQGLLPIDQKKRSMYMKEAVIIKISGRLDSIDDSTRSVRECCHQVNVKIWVAV